MDGPEDEPCDRCGPDLGGTDTMSDTSDLIKGLYYGPAKRRKTTYMAGAARLCTGRQKILAIDTEGAGWLKYPLRKRGIDTDKIIHRKATSYNDMEAIFWEMEPRVESGEIIAVNVDHLSDLEQRFIRAATMARQTKKSGLGRIDNFRSAEALIAKGVNPFMTELGDYGVWTNQARHLMRLYRDLPCHVMFGAHYRIEAGKWVPGLTEKFREELMGSLNLIVGADLHEFGDEDEDIIGIGVCRELGLWRGGDRIGITRPKTVNPSMDRLVMALTGKLDFAEDPEQKEFRDRFTAQLKGE